MPAPIPSGTSLEQFKCDMFFYSPHSAGDHYRLFLHVKKFWTCQSMRSDQDTKGCGVEPALWRISLTTVCKTWSHDTNPLICVATTFWRVEVLHQYVLLTIFFYIQPVFILLVLNGNQDQRLTNYLWIPIKMLCKEINEFMALSLFSIIRSYTYNGNYKRYVTTFWA